MAENSLFKVLRHQKMNTSRVIYCEMMLLLLFHALKVNKHVQRQKKGLKQ